MLRGHEKRKGGTEYNEVIVDTGFLQGHLPGSVEAIFYVAGSSTSVQDFARRVHGDMARQFGLDERTFPLLVIDPGAADAPFARAG